MVYYIVNLEMFSSLIGFVPKAKLSTWRSILNLVYNLHCPNKFKEENECRDIFFICALCTGCATVFLIAYLILFIDDYL